MLDKLKGGFLAHKRKLVGTVLAILALLGAFALGDADLVTTLTDIFGVVTSGPADQAAPAAPAGG